MVPKNIAGRIKPPWISRPTMTVTMYIPSCLATTSRSPMAAIFPAIRDAMPIGEYLNSQEWLKWSWLRLTLHFLCDLNYFNICERWSENISIRWILFVGGLRLFWHKWNYATSNYFNYRLMCSLFSWFTDWLLSLEHIQKWKKWLPHNDLTL